MKPVLLLFMLAYMAGAQTWDKLVDRYFDEAVFPYNPSAATQAGFHNWDDRLENLSVEAVHRQTGILRLFEKEVTAFPGQPADRDLVLSNIRSTLLSLEAVRMWEKNPDLYSSTASNAAFVIMSRSFAPPAVRLRSLIAREKQVPKLLLDARINLKNPPKIYTEVALDQLPGIIGFFQKDVPLAFKDVKDAALLKDFAASNGAVIQVRQKNSWVDTGSGSLPSE
jgi:hypothetical protein